MDSQFVLSDHSAEASLLCEWSQRGSEVRSALTSLHTPVRLNPAVRRREELSGVPTLTKRSFAPLCGWAQVLQLQCQRHLMQTLLNLHIPHYHCLLAQPSLVLVFIVMQVSVCVWAPDMNDSSGHVLCWGECAATLLGPYEISYTLFKVLFSLLTNY